MNKKCASHKIEKWKLRNVQKREIRRKLLSIRKRSKKCASLLKKQRKVENTVLANMNKKRASRKKKRKLRNKKEIRRKLFE